MEITSNNIVIWNTPKHPKFNLYNKRLESFINHSWPIGLTQTPETLAGAGLFYLGSGDKVLCYYCNGGIHNWMPEDEPWKEHKKHYPNCAYLKLINPGYEYNIREDVNDGTKKGLEASTSSQLHNLDLKTGNMVHSGKNLTLFKKIMKIKCKSSEVSKQEIPLQETLTHIQDDRMCKLCITNEANIVLIPCGHLLVCKHCAASIIKCPVCRCKIKQLVKVYFS